MNRSVLTGLSLTAALFFGGVAASTAQDAPPQQQAAEKALQAKIARLIDGLGAEAYEVREKAFDQLVAIGPPAIAALERARQSEDPEVAAAAAEALAAIRVRHKLPQVKPQPRPESQDPEAPAPGTEPRREGPGFPQPLPGRDEMMEQLQKQFPEMEELLKRFREGPQMRLLDPNDPMLKEFFGGKNPFEELFGQDGEGQFEEREGPNGRSRVFTWSNVPRPQGPAVRLGARVRAASPVLRAQLGLAPNEGLAVHQLAAQGFGAAQGLQQYDVIVAVDGKSVQSEADLAGLVEKGGQLTIVRQAKRQTLTLPAAPALKRAPLPRPLRPRSEPPQPKPQPVPPKQGDDQRDF